MPQDRRLTFVRKWLQRAQRERDPFDQFFAAWIALIIAAQISRDERGFQGYDDTDRQRVLDFFLEKQRPIARALEENQGVMEQLARRRGTTHRNPIVDTGNAALRDAFQRLSLHYTTRTRMSDTELVQAVAELVNRVRNSVFHGAKVYDDRDDLELLTLVNPVILGILRHTQSTPAERIR